MRGSGTSRYFSAFTYMPATCYRGKEPTTCTYDQKTYWVSDLVTAKRGIAPCNIYPRSGKVCWTYLGHVGLSDGGGVQDQASRKHIKTVVTDLTKRLQPPNNLVYKGINLGSIQKSPATEQLTVALLNSSYNLWQNVSKNGDSDCWICFPFSTRSNIVGIPLPMEWPLPNSTTANSTVHIGPIGENIPIINVSSPLTTTAANITNSSLPCCTPLGIFLSCPQGIYRCLTTNDSLGCIFILLSPSTTIYSESQLLSILFPQHRGERAVFLPFIIGAGVAIGVATGTAGIGTSIDFYYKLSQALNDDMERVADSLTALQTQVTSLAALALQNRRALDLLTAEKGGTCLFLNEECCYFVNQSGIVTSKIKELRDRIQARRRDTSSWGLDPYSWVIWLLPLVGPVCIILLLISVAPCLFRYLQGRLQELARVSVNQLLLQPYSPLPTSDYPYDHAPCQQEVARTESAPLTPLY
ncbi:syncytin-1-like [Neovison vison]|uniref:syncytin-1-like n=1 Tax=Neovison vison TaxID=452646 RepID=UPI001CF0B708|nr:syncytin-1-like [Neogale vison]